MKSVQVRKTLVFLAKGVETIEMGAFIDVLGWARDLFGLNTQVVTCGFTREVVSTFNIPIKPDILIDEIQVNEFDALAIPGGFGQYGFYEEVYSEKFLDLIRAFDHADKIIATICVGSLPLGKSGILENRKATTYHLNEGKRQKQLSSFRVNVVNERVVRDRNVISSYCPETAFDVAFLLLEMLTSKADAQKVKTAMGF